MDTSVEGVCSFFHIFFLAEAAFLFPKIKVEVCLSAPVLREMADGPPKMTLEYVDQVRQGVLRFYRTHQPQPKEANNATAPQDSGREGTHRLIPVGRECHQEGRSCHGPQ